MVRTLSTYVFLRRRLTPALLTDIARYSVTAVEIFCARAHFDYQSADVVREIAGALRDHNLTLHALHAPSERDFNLTHESSTPLSISDPERVRRLEAVDEIKRALDVAEYIPYRYLVQHMGSSRDAADERHFDAAFSSLEHLRIFAKERGVTSHSKLIVEAVKPFAWMAKFPKPSALSHEDAGAISKKWGAALKGR